MLCRLTKPQIRVACIASYPNLRVHSTAYVLCRVKSLYFFVVLLTGCGSRQHLLARGIAPEILSEIDEAGEVDLDAWFTGFSGEEQAVRDSVAMLRAHPLMPRDVVIHGLIIDSFTGALRVLEQDGQKT